MNGLSQVKVDKARRIPGTGLSATESGPGPQADPRRRELCVGEQDPEQRPDEHVRPTNPTRLRVAPAVLT